MLVKSLKLMVWCTYKQTPPPLRPSLSRRNTLKSGMLISPSDISSVSQVSEMASIIGSAEALPILCVRYFR